MKVYKIIFFLSLAICFYACRENKTQKAIEKITLKITVLRFENELQLLKQSNDSNILIMLRNKYADFFENLGWKSNEAGSLKSPALFLKDSDILMIVATPDSWRKEIVSDTYLELEKREISRDDINQLAKKLGFDKLIEFDNRTINITAKHSSLLGDAFESLVGAVYLDKGYNFTKNFLAQRIVKPHVDILTLEQTETNFKSKLIEWLKFKLK